MDKQQKEGFFVKMAKNVLLRNGYKFERKVAYDKVDVPNASAVGRLEAANLMLAQELKSHEKKEEKEDNSDTKRWAIMKSRMLRVSGFEGAKLFGPSEQGYDMPLSAVVSEIYFDGKTGLYWLNARTGNSNVILDGKPWHDLVDTSKHNNKDHLYIFYTRGSDGSFQYVSPVVYEPIMKPADTFLPKDKVNVSEISRVMGEMDDDAKLANDLLLVANSKQRELENALLSKVSSLEGEIDTILKALRKGEKKDGKSARKPEDTSKESKDNTVQ
jgi:hypothetical protein